MCPLHNACRRWLEPPAHCAGVAAAARPKPATGHCTLSHQRWCSAPINSLQRPATPWPRSSTATPQTTIAASMQPALPRYSTTTTVMHTGWASQALAAVTQQLRGGSDGRSYGSRNACLFWTASKHAYLVVTNRLGWVAENVASYGTLWAGNQWIACVGVCPAYGES